MSKYDFLLPETQSPTDTFRFGIITGQDPLRVRLDGDIDSIVATPIVVNDPGVIGTRVLVLIHNRQFMIIGRARIDTRLLTSSSNLNSFTTTGLHYVINSGDTSFSRNFPIEQAGELEIQAHSAGYARQTYNTWTSTVGLVRKFTRHYYNGSWRPWSEEELWTPWTPMVLGNGWTVYSTSFHTPAWRMSGINVELRGLAAPGALTGVITTLPPEARPAKAVILKPQVWVTQSTPYRLDVSVNGNLSFTGLAAGVGWTSFDGESYSLG